tara:strand:- start:6324 stop:6629 length:306 start_codon:yes stop_codon:yes gene_type:complete
MSRDVKIVDYDSPLSVRESESEVLESFEGSVNDTVEIAFAKTSRNIILANDSVSLDLQYKFSTPEDFATLKPAETVTLEFAADSILFSTLGAVNYRLWVYA